jgi:hypothetical protein
MDSEIQEFSTHDIVNHGKAVCETCWVALDGEWIEG